MGNLLLSILFIVALVLVFYLANIIGHLFKFDEYMRKHNFRY